MLICIPSNGGGGLEDTVCEHFGAAPYFTLLDSESGEVVVVKNRNAHHSHGTCHPLSQLGGFDIDGVICGGMGRRAMGALKNQGVTVFHADSSRVSDVAEQVKAGSLREMDLSAACRGHGQRGPATCDGSGGHGHGGGEKGYGSRGA